MRTSLYLALAVLLAVTFVGCAPSLEHGAGDGGVTLTAAPAIATAGGAVTLTLRNGSEAEVGYNLCASGLHRSVGDGWQPVPEDRACTMELRLLAPGGEADIALDLPADLEAGTYRYETRVEDMPSGEAETVASNTFRVD